MEGPQVVTAQPSTLATVHPLSFQQPGISPNYTVGLCDCCHSCGTCFLVSLCPWIAMCLATAKIGENWCYPLCFGVLPVSVRFRTLSGIHEGMCIEGCEACWCMPCFLCRLLNEEEIRGYS